MLRLIMASLKYSFFYTVIKAPPRYAVQEGDATMMLRASWPGLNKLYKT